MSDVRLIERWLPIAELSEESVRERRSMTALPPIYYLHVWWARRPLVASRAAILASLLPADADRAQFKHVLGIHGDPLAAKKRIDDAKRTGENLGLNVYGYKRAFQYQPSPEDFSGVLGRRPDELTLLDATAGGGSIPLEARRLGLRTFANDINPVAALILLATVDYPATYGRKVVLEFDGVARRMRERMLPKFAGIYPKEPEGGRVEGYVLARTVTCPYCSGLVPLSPNWKLAPDGTGVRLRPHLGEGPGSEGRKCSFEIVGAADQQSPGTVSGGDGLCPFADCGRVIDGAEVKRQAQAGHLGDQLFAVVYKRIVSRGKTGKPKWERGYRGPRPQDDNSAEIGETLAAKLPEWEALGVVPTENYPTVSCDERPIQYGMPLWRDMFSPRQLLAHGFASESYRELVEEDRRSGELTDLRRAAYVYLALSIDTNLNYGNRSCRWDSVTQRVRSIFDRHDFAFCWSYAEMATLIEGLGYDWAVEKTSKCIGELIDLTNNQSGPLFTGNIAAPPLTITCKSGDDLDHIPTASVDAVIVDPPYGANVMYAELSDFFYVWLKRTAGLVVPELFTRYLTDKDAEAVANRSRFAGEKGADKLATRHYQDRMAAIFAEARRVLTADGIMTVMFTHKDTGAWDALTKGLMTAGFRITASWPVNTESEGSLHIKDKAAANSTIFLVCRPRPEEAAEDKMEYWEDVEPLVAQAVRDRVAEFQAAGIRGVDLALASFGPALEKFSEHWPLRRGSPRPEPKRKSRQLAMFEEEFDPYAVTPEDALNAARREVVKWRLDQITQIAVRADLDPATAWFVLAWDFFESSTFSYDEGLRLARAVGVDLDTEIVKRFAEKKGSDLRLWDSKTRAEKAVLGPPDGSRSMLDALHGAAWAARSKSLDAARTLLVETGAATDPAFLRALEAVLEVLPVSVGLGGLDPLKDLNKAAGDDFEALENLRRLAFSEDVGEPEQLKQLMLDLEPVSTAA